MINAIIDNLHPIVHIVHGHVIIQRAWLMSLLSFVLARLGYLIPGICALDCRGLPPLCCDLILLGHVNQRTPVLLTCPLLPPVLNSMYIKATRIMDTIYLRVAPRQLIQVNYWRIQRDNNRLKKYKR